MNRYIEVEVANNFIKRLIGLSFKKNIKHSLLIPKCSAIHTFFMREEIDIIVLNNKNVVIKMFRNVKRNKVIKVKYNNNEVNILEVSSKFDFKCLIDDTIIFI